MSECSDKAGDRAKRRKKCPEFSKISPGKLKMILLKVRGQAGRLRPS
jgi:hypothetical protein